MSDSISNNGLDFPELCELLKSQGASHQMSNSNGSVGHDYPLIDVRQGNGRNMNESYETTYGAAVYVQPNLTTETDDPGNVHKVPSSGTMQPFRADQNLPIPESGQSSASNQHEERTKGQKRKQPARQEDGIMINSVSVDPAPGGIMINSVSVNPAPAGAAGGGLLVSALPEGIGRASIDMQNIHVAETSGVPQAAAVESDEESMSSQNSQQQHQLNTPAGIKQKNLKSRADRLLRKSFQGFILRILDKDALTQCKQQFEQQHESKRLREIEEELRQIQDTCSKFKKKKTSSRNRSIVKKENELKQRKQELVSELESLNKQVNERDKESTELLKRFLKRGIDTTILREKLHSVSPLLFEEDQARPEQDNVDGHDIVPDQANDEQIDCEQTDNQRVHQNEEITQVTDQVEEITPFGVPAPVAEAVQDNDPVLDSATTLELHSLSPHRFNKDQAGPSQYVDDGNDEPVEEFIKRLDASNRTLTTSEFEGLDKDLERCTGWSIPKSLEFFAIKIQKACNKTATFEDLPVLITVCATMKEMNKVQRLEQVNEAGLLRWAAAINRGAASGFKLKSAKEHLRYIAYAYFGSKAGDEKLKIIGERLETIGRKKLKLEAEYEEIKKCVDAAQGFQGSFCLIDGLFD